jgi:Kef-type K+ transport system membrane component KefB
VSGVNDLLLHLALTLIAAEAGGFVSSRLGLTRVVGQITAGLIVGPSLLGLVHDDLIVQALAGVGALSLLAIAGLETNVRELRSVGRPAILSALGGVALPMIGGTALVSALGYDLRAALFCGAVLTATSVGISVAALRELGLGPSRAGTTILGAAVLDDILGLVVLALVVAETGVGLSPVGAMVPMTIVLVGSAAAAWRFGDRLAGILDQLHGRGGGTAAMVGLILGVAWVFQAIGGLAGITGAYVAGLAVAGSAAGDRLRERLVHAGEALCVPVFFVAIGLSVDLHALPAALPAFGGLLLVAVLGKLAGCGVGARLGGLGGWESAGVGIGMVARGEVALIAATIGRASGAIDPALHAALVLMALATTILAPVGLSVWARRPRFEVAIGETVADRLVPVRASWEAE